uniref:Uncharacterized protein n=1 Tax=Oryza rufipogon TaxID=4529 RepID=A0A0E0MR00_ORYRU
MNRKVRALPSDHGYTFNTQLFNGGREVRQMWRPTPDVPFIYVISWDILVMVTHMGLRPKNY